MRSVGSIALRLKRSRGGGERSFLQLQALLRSETVLFSLDICIALSYGDLDFV